VTGTRDLTLETSLDRLQFNAHGCLVSLRSKAGAEQETIAWQPDHPAFVIGYLDEDRQYRLMSSADAQSVTVDRADDGETSTLTFTFHALAGQELDVTCTVGASRDDPFSRWRIRVNNRAGMIIVDVQYPFLVCPYDIGGASSPYILLPYWNGRLLHAAVAADLTRKLVPDSWRAWEFTSVNGDMDHYPGSQFAQFLAIYGDRGGLYLMCNDTAGNVKRFRGLHRDPGIRVGVSHVGDWPTDGERELEYETLLRTFEGDWYDAAGMYREWTLGQKWGTPLARRQDVPAWLIDSPVYITIRPQGILDDGPVFPVQEFLPIPDKCIPLLGRVAERTDAPVTAVLMGWERAASWVYPDCFPPVGGDQGMTELARQARERGWHIGSFCNGSRWVVGHLWNGYDGRDYFKEHGGAATVCREANGSMWEESWDRTWRPSYPCCLGVDQTRAIALDFVKRLIGWGWESIQFFDQNCGATTFACFGQDHSHSPTPGKWMLAAMEQTIKSFQQAALDAGQPDVINSAEAGVNECCLPLFQETDMRIYPPGYNPDFVPLYQFLFHECIIIQGMMGNSPEPYHLPIRNATNCVYGEIPGAVMTGDGTLLNKDTGNWAPWEPHVGSDDDALEMIRTVTALRRGPGKDFLVLGRMLRPRAVSGVPVIEWMDGDRKHAIPAVFDAAWQAPDGRVGIVLANWTTEERAVGVHAGQLRGRLHLHVSGRHLSSAALPSGDLRVIVPPLGCALVEG
jgi:hypothetical protein